MGTINDNNYSGTATDTLVIAKANQTITFGTLPSKPFTDPDFALTATASSGLAVTYVSSDPTVATVTTGGTVHLVKTGTTTFTASQAGNANYNAASDGTSTLVVLAAGQTITFGTLPAKTYGAVDFALGATASSTLPVSYVSSNTAVATVSSNTVTIVGAGTTTITASQAGNGNFAAATDVTQTLTVNKAAATVTLGNLSATYDGTPKAATATTVPAGLTVSVTYAGNSTAPTAVGNYAVVGTINENNYVGSATGTLAITKANQTITFGALPVKVFGDASFALSATASSTLAVTYASSNKNVATVSGSTVTLVGWGTTTITASQAGDGNFNAATNVPQTLTVNPPAPVITSALTALAVQNSNFLYQITTNPTLATFSATVLPAGLNVNTTTGIISGTPTARATTTVTLTATNATASDTKTLTITVNPPPPVITSAPAASGQAGTAFTYSIVGTNTPTSYSLTGTLPTGVTLNTSTGVISGTPAAGTAGMYSIIVTATNATGSVSQPLVISIAAPPLAPAYSGTTGLSGQQAALAPFSFTPAFTNNVTGYAITAGALPAGLALNTATGAITGNPTVTGTFAFTLTATGSGGATAVPFTLTINPAPTAPVVTLTKATDTATVGSAYTGPAVTPAPSTGLTFAATWMRSDSATPISTPPAGFTFSNTTGAIGGTPAATSVGTYTVRIKAANTAGTGPEAVLVITVNPSPNAPIITSVPIVQGQVGVALAAYQLTTSTAATAFSITSASPPTWLNLNTSTGAVTGTPNTAGPVSVVFAAADTTNGQGLGLEVLFNIAPAVTAPVVNSNGTASGQVGQPFQYAITATNGPITGFAVVGTLPDGLLLDAGGSGVISGIPSTATTSPISVALTATNVGGTSNPKTLTITIAAPPATPVITSALTLSGQVGTAFTATTYQTTASASPTSFLASGLPAGLTINSTTGAITGTPTVAGTFSATLRAANTGGLGAPSTFVGTIVPAVAAPSITSAAAVAGQVGVAFTYTIAASPGPITSYGLTGTLPLGLALNTATGVLSGKPAESGLFAVNLTATNAGGTSLPQQLVLGLNPALGVPVVTSAMYVVAQVGTAFVVTPPTYQITATNMPASTPYAPPN